MRDITEEKNAAEKLVNTLHEKEVLLREVHHRVKNNLQIISSLLNLQTNYINNDETKNLYVESQNRIKSIASIHELLYQSDDLGKINFKEYLQKLVSDLIYSYLGDENFIEINIETEAKFNVDTSIPLGLLINEIISNSLKHGLKNKKNDLISISIEKIEGIKYVLKISDNGVGYKVTKPKKEIESLGLMLIEELSSQLNGNIEKLDVAKGTSYSLVFEEC